MARDQCEALNNLDSRLTSSVDVKHLGVLFLVGRIQLVLGNFGGELSQCHLV